MAANRVRSSWTAASGLLCRECASRQNLRLAPSSRRTFATTIDTEEIPQQARTNADSADVRKSAQARKTKLCPRDLFPQPKNPFLQTAPVTLYSFPEYKPASTVEYPDTHLLLPLRRDILHRAIIYEGDNTRQGTASTKWRDEVHGSGRKIRPQKGGGTARLGDKKSPMLRGGGVAFGPKPRDFGTELPRKIYDLAWRTALSYRYRRGELVVVTGMAEIKREGPGATRWALEMLEHNGWGRQHGGSLIVTKERRDLLFTALQPADKSDPGHLTKEARCRTIEDVDVKDLLKGGRVIIEEAALKEIFRLHTADLKSGVRVAPGLDEKQISLLRGTSAQTAALAS